MVSFVTLIIMPQYAFFYTFHFTKFVKEKDTNRFLTLDAKSC
jgi:hypothetical protein